MTSSLRNILGFTEFPSGASVVFHSNAVPDVSPIKAINFHFNSVPSRSFALYPSVQYTRLLATLFVGNASPYSVIESTDETIYKESTVTNNLRKIELSLHDQRGDLVELQNGSFQMLVEFSFRPKKVFKIFDMIT